MKKQLLLILLVFLLSRCEKIDQHRDAQIRFKVTSVNPDISAAITHTTPEDGAVRELNIELPWELEITKSVQSSTPIELAATSGMTDSITIELSIDGEIVQKETGDSTNHNKLIIIYQVP